VLLPLCRAGCEVDCNCIGRETSWRSFPVELPLVIETPPDLKRTSVTVFMKTCWLDEDAESVRALVPSSGPSLLRSITSDSEPDLDDGAAAMLKQLWSQPSNAKCADCGAPSSWASVSIGVFICIRCAGLHRGLGRVYTQIYT
jgi:hypothetical protein